VSERQAAPNAESEEREGLIREYGFTEAEADAMMAASGGGRFIHPPSFRTLTAAEAAAEAAWERQLETVDAARGGREAA